MLIQIFGELKITDIDISVDIHIFVFVLYVTVFVRVIFEKGNDEIIVCLLSSNVFHKESLCWTNWMMYELPQFSFYALGKFTKRKIFILLDNAHVCPILIKLQQANNTSQPIYWSGSNLVSITEVQTAGVKIINRLKCFCFVSSCLPFISLKNIYIFESYIAFASFSLMIK